MIEVSGEMPLGEGRKAGVWVLQRLFGRGWASVGLILLYPMAVSAWVMSVNDYEAGGWLWIALAIAFALYLVWAFLLQPRLVHRLWRKLGAPATDTVRFRVEDDGLHITSAVRTTLVHWPAVLQLTRGGPYWLLMVSETAFSVPRRFFADAAAEKAFVAACLDRMSPEARARSGKATAFAG